MKGLERNTDMGNELEKRRGRSWIPGGGGVVTVGPHRLD